MGQDREFEFKKGKLKITLALYRNDKRMAEYTAEAKLRYNKEP